MPISEWGMVRSDGTATPLNEYDIWLSSYDIRRLPSGYYAGYVQTTNKNPNYKLAINLPHDVDGYVVEIEVVDFGFEGRKNFRVIRNVDGVTYTATCTNNVLTNWNFEQQKRLTYSDGSALNWDYGTDNPLQDGEATDLLVPITDLETGFYRGAINKPTGIETRNLPKIGFPYGQTFSAIVVHTPSKRKTIILTAMYTHISWIGSSGENGQEIIWKRLDGEEDILGEDKALFSIEMNKRDTTHFNLLTITDTHAQEHAPSTQIGHVNPDHFKNIEDLDRQIKTNDITVHLGDWIDGNYEKKLASYSLAHLGSKFYEKPNRYGIIGNHDYNGQWNGNAGNNEERKGDLNYLFTTDEVKHFLTPNGEPYYYVDHPEKKIRMIYLHAYDVPFWTNQYNRLYVDPLEQKGFGAKQVEWYIDTLKTVPMGFNVIIITHDSFNKVFENSTFYNGDIMRTISEAYQNKKTANKMTTDIGATNPIYPYYQLEVCMDGCIDFSTSHGQILSVVSGHRHEDATVFLNGIRYITLLCSRATGEGTPNKPARDYYSKNSEAITFLEFDTEDKVILSYRFGAGEPYRKYNMLTH